MLLLACLVLAALIACLAAAAARPARLLARGVMVLAVLWLFVNQPIEGPILWRAGSGHGLTLGDLLTPTCLIAGAWLLRRASLARLGCGDFIGSSRPGLR